MIEKLSSFIANKHDFQQQAVHRNAEFMMYPHVAGNDAHLK